MKRRKESPGVAAYYEAMQRIFHLQSEILTGAIPHYGERGRNDEERCRAFLAKVLPKRFSVGSGFVVCSNQSTPPSSQTDIVIFDEIYNSPLHQELSSFIYPVEMVYGTVEVKGTLSRANLLKTCRDISKVRTMGESRWYRKYTSVQKHEDEPNSRVVGIEEFEVRTPSPRAFVFAYEKKDWRKLDDLVASMASASRETGIHFHGLVVVSKNWYVTQEAHARGGPKFMAYEKDALLLFVLGLIHSVSSYRMHQMSINRYLKPDGGIGFVTRNTSPAVFERSKKRS